MNTPGQNLTTPMMGVNIPRNVIYPMVAYRAAFKAVNVTLVVLTFIFPLGRDYYDPYLNLL
jgi:hypothetical protein